MLRVVTFLCLLMAVSVAQPSIDSSPPVLDTAGRALEAGVEYYILPADTNRTTETNVGGGLTLVNRNRPCPLYVGQEDNVESKGFPVTFNPFFAGETIIRLSRDFNVSFSALTTCVQSTAWRLGRRDTVTGRRLIDTGLAGDGRARAGDYFRIRRDGDSYKLGWCPTDVCPLCRFDCGTAGVSVINGKRLLALNGPEGPELLVVFKKA